MSTSATTRCRFFILFSLLHVWPSFSKEEKCNSEDKRVLLNIKKALNDAYLLNSWTPDLDCCSWHGVFCDSTTHHVTALTFLDGDLPGRIPDAIGDLPYLQEIIFHKLTNLSGPIPYSFTKLKYLNSMDISWVNLTGNIPGYLGTSDSHSTPFHSLPSVINGTSS